MIKCIVGSHAWKPGWEAGFIDPAKAVAFVEAMGRLHFVYGAEIKVCNSPGLAKGDERFDELLGDAFFFSAEFLPYEHFPDDAGVVTCVDHGDRADEFAVLEGAPESAAGTEVVAVDVEEVRLIFEGDRDVEFLLLDREDEVDRLPGVIV